METNEIENQLKPHGNRSRAFPNAHVPRLEIVNSINIVTELFSHTKPELLLIFDESDAYFRSNNRAHGSGLQSLFKNNILFLCDFYGIGLNDLFRRKSSMGIRGSYQAFLNGNGTKYFSLLYLAMFSRIFRIEAGLLVGCDLRQAFSIEKDIAIKHFSYTI